MFLHQQPFSVTGNPLGVLWPLLMSDACVLCAVCPVFWKKTQAATFETWPIIIGLTAAKSHIILVAFTWCGVPFFTTKLCHFIELNNVYGCIYLKSGCLDIHLSKVASPEKILLFICCILSLVLRCDIVVCHMCKHVSHLFCHICAPVTSGLSHVRTCDMGHLTCCCDILEGY